MQVGVKNIQKKQNLTQKKFNSKLKWLKSVKLYMRGDKGKDNTNLNIMETARK